MIKKKKDVKVSPKQDALKELLRVKLPAVFEREPAPAYVEPALDSLVKEILSL